MCGNVSSSWAANTGFWGEEEKGDFGFDVGADAQHLLVKDGMMMMTRPPSHRSC